MSNSISLSLKGNRWGGDTNMQVWRHTSKWSGWRWVAKVKNRQISLNRQNVEGHSSANILFPEGNNSWIVSNTWLVLTDIGIFGDKYYSKFYFNLNNPILRTLRFGIISQLPVPQNSNWNFRKIPKIVSSDAHVLVLPFSARSAW